MSTPLTCRELIGFLDDYRDARLAAEQRERFDRHLERCSDCRAYLESYDRAVLLARAVMTRPEDGLGDDVPPDLVAAILASRRAGN
jgi:anti-sigma factor RsiW